MPNGADKAKITLIDDDKGMVNSLKEFLESRGFIVSFAYGGLSGLEVIKRERPDLVILDISMPDMDGRDVLVELKKDDDIKDTPVIMLTGREEQFEREHGMELGAYEYLNKPYDSYVLLRQITNVLQKRDTGEL